MNKTIIILFLLFAAGAFTIQFTGVYDIAGAAANLPATITSGTGKLSTDPIGYIKDNFAAIATVASTVGGCTTIFSFIYDKLKTQATQAINNEKTVRIQQGQQLLDVTTQRDNALAQIEDLTKQKNTALDKAEAAVSDTKKETDKLKAQVTQLEQEKNELKRLFNYVDDKVIINKKLEPVP